MKSSLNRAALPVVKLSVLAVGLALATSADAIQFKFDNGVSGSFDTTVSYGISIRTQDAAADLIGIANGGTARSVNEDDGDRNYKKGKPFAHVVKATHDLDLKWDGWGLFARGTYFVDAVNRNKAELGPLAKERVGTNARMLDAFITRGFDVYGSGVKVRLGHQVISWGESTFIPNSINSINSVDLVKLRTPGSEIKEAFLPTPSFWASIALTKSASLEAYYLFNHDKIKLDPRGSYWSNNDFASDDADRVFVGFARRGDLTGVAVRNPIPPNAPGIGGIAAQLYGPFRPDAQVWAPRLADRDPSDHGQYGFAFRYLATELNNTEFGLYYQNFHSRTPLFSGTKGTVTSALTGGPLAALVGHTGTANYFAEYPENIRLFGVSFNTQGPFGIALQGELSYRPNQPLQFSTPELLLAALGAPNLITGFETIEGTVGGTSPPPRTGTCATGFVTIPGTVGSRLAFGISRSALVPDCTYQRGWDRVKVSQYQVTATKTVPNFLRAEQLVLVGEFGYTKYHGLRQDVKFNGPAVFLPATSEGAVASQSGGRQTEGFVTDSSYGYRLVGRLDYNSVIFGANMSPRVAFNHDVKGTSQTFNEGIKSTSVGVNFEYQRKLTLDLSYTSFFGGRTYCGTDTVTNPNQTTLAASIIPGLVPGFTAQSANYCSSANPIKDRDFYSLVVTYSF